MPNLLNVAVILRLVDQFTAPMRSATGALSGLDTAAKTSSVAQGLHSVGQNAAVSGALVGAAGLGMKAALNDVVKPAQDFEKAISELAAVANTDQAGLESLRDKAMLLGRDTWASASQATAAMTELAKQGFKVEEILTASGDLLNLGRAAGITLAQAAAVTGTTLHQFGLDATQTARVADVLTAAANGSATSVHGIAEALKYAGPVAASAGLSLEQTSAMIALLSNNGIDASQAGTTLSSMVARLAALPKPAAEALEALGVATRKANGDMRPITETLAAIDKAMAAKNYGSAQRLEAMNHIFGLEHIAGGGKLVEGMAKGGFAELFDAIAGSAGQAAKTANVMGDNLAGRMQELDGSMETLRITLGNFLIPTLTEAAQVAAQFVNRITGIAQANPEIVRLGLILAAAATAAALVIGPALIAFGALASGAGLALTAISALMGPIGLLVAALVGAAVVIYRNWDGIAAFFDGLWTGFLAGLEPIRPGLDALAAAFAPILDAGAGLLDWLQSLLSPVEGLSTAAGDLGAGWGRMLGAVAAAAADPWLAEAAALAVTSWEALPGALDTVGGALSRLWGWAQEFMAGWTAGFQGAFDPTRFAALSQAVGPLGDALGLLGAAVADLVGRIAVLFGAMDQASGGAAGLGEMVGRLTGGALNTLADLILMAATTMTGLAQAMAAVLSGDFAGVVVGWQTALGGVLTFLESLSQRLTGMSLYEIGAAILQGLADGLASGTMAVVSTVEQLAGSIIGRFKSLLGIASPSTVFAEFGQWIMDGLSGGLMARVQTVIDQVSGIAGSVIGRFKSVLGINSPSRVFATAGGDIVAGLALGIQSDAPDAVAAAAGLSRTVAGAAAAAAVAIPLTVSAAAAALPDLSAAQSIAMPAMEPLPAVAGPAGAAPAAGAGPVTVNVSISLSGGDQDVLRRLEDWVRGEGGRLIADTVRREQDRQSRTVFDPRGDR